MDTVNSVPVTAKLDAGEGGEKLSPGCSQMLRVPNSVSLARVHWESDASQPTQWAL